MRTGVRLARRSRYALRPNCQCEGSLAARGNMAGMRAHHVAVCCLLLAGCTSLEYDLAAVPFPVSASPAPTPGEPFLATGKSILWVHGLFGKSEADVAALVRGADEPCTGVASFRAQASTSFHDWLVTHLTLGLIRMKTVTVTGERLRS